MRTQTARRLTSVISRRDQFLVACAAAIPLLVWWLGWYPGFLSFDSIDQLDQAQSGRIFDFHPAVHTILLRWIGLGTAAPGVVTFLQGAGLVALMSLAAGRLFELGVPRWAAIVVPALVPWLPSVAQTTLTVWKDIPFTLALVWLFLELMGVAARGPLHLRTHTVRFGLLLAAVWLFRHNGLLTVLGLLLVMAVIIRRAVLWVRMLSLMAITIFLVVGPLYAMYDVDRSRPTSSEVMIGDVAAAFLKTDIYEPEDVTYLSSIAPRQTWEDLYDCDDSNPILFDPAFGKDVIRLDGNQFLARGLEAWGQALPTVASHRLCAASYLFVPVQPDDAYLHRPPFAVPENDLGISRDPIVDSAYDLTFAVFQAVEPADRLWLTWRPALILYAGLAVWVFIAARRPRSWLLPGALFGIHFINVSITSLNQEFRFALPLVIMALLSLPLLLTPDRP